MMTRRLFTTTAAASVAAAPLSSDQSTSDFKRLPAEEEPHELTFMQWPNRSAGYGDMDFLWEVQNTIVKIASTIAEFEPVVMLAHKGFHDEIRNRISGKVEIWNVPTEDLWARDSGPLTIVHNSSNRNTHRSVVDFNFNGWGNRQRHHNDRRVARLCADHLGFPISNSGLVGEPGGFEQDGQGLLIAHESSWVNDNRNLASRDTIEQKLMTSLGVRSVIWAPGVWHQDITDYHIDGLARFTGPGQILIQLPDNPDFSDDYHIAALETHDILKAAGLGITVIPEPVTPRNRSSDFVAAYANYYVCNGAVIAAHFGDRDADQEAIRALKHAYQGREIVTLNADMLGELGGGIHCATQQLPTA